MLSSLTRNSQEPKLKRSFGIRWVLFEKSLSLYFDWHKSWIWRTLEKVMNIFCKWHFHNASKEVFWQKFFLNFMHGFKSAILAIFSFARVKIHKIVCQRGKNCDRTSHHKKCPHAHTSHTQLEMSFRKHFRTCEGAIIHTSAPHRNVCLWSWDFSWFKRFGLSWTRYSKNND